MTMLDWLRQRRAERQAATEAKRVRREAEAENERRRKAELRQIKANVLDILGDGKLPYINVNFKGGPSPFRLQKSEQLIWAFQDAEHIEQKTRRDIVGRSGGVSVRVAKGVSVRMGH